MAKLEKRRIMPKYCKNDSPVLSITYQTDKNKNENLSIKYSDISETEVHNLHKKLEDARNRSKIQCLSTPVPTKTAQTNNITTDFRTSENYHRSGIQNNLIKENKNYDPVSEIDFTDYFEANIGNVANKMKIMDQETIEYHKILDELSRNDKDYTNLNVNHEVVKNISKNISESLRQIQESSEDLWENMTDTDSKISKLDAKYSSHKNESEKNDRYREIAIN
jgi:hypothetical protein